MVRVQAVGLAPVIVPLVGRAARSKSTIVRTEATSQLSILTQCDVITAVPTGRIEPDAKDWMFFPCGLKVPSPRGLPVCGEGGNLRKISPTS